MMRFLFFLSLIVIISAEKPNSGATIQKWWQKLKEVLPEQQGPQRTPESSGKVSFDELEEIPKQKKGVRLFFPAHAPYSVSRAGGKENNESRDDAIEMNLNEYGLPINNIHSETKFKISLESPEADRKTAASKVKNESSNNVKKSSLTDGLFDDISFAEIAKISPESTNQRVDTLNESNSRKNYNSWSAGYLKDFPLHSRNRSKADKKASDSKLKNGSSNNVNGTNLDNFSIPNNNANLTEISKISPESEASETVNTIDESSGLKNYRSWSDKFFKGLPQYSQYETEADEKVNASGVKNESRNNVDKINLDNNSTLINEVELRKIFGAYLELARADEKVNASGVKNESRNNVDKINLDKNSTLINEVDLRKISRIYLELAKANGKANALRVKNETRNNVNRTNSDDYSIPNEDVSLKRINKINLVSPEANEKTNASGVKNESRNDVNGTNFNGSSIPINEINLKKIPEISLVSSQAGEKDIVSKEKDESKKNAYGVTWLILKLKKLIGKETN